VIGNSGTRGLVLVAMLAATLGALAPPASGQFRDRLDRALAAPGVSRAQTGAIAIDLHTGKTVYARGARRSLEPASNQKLLVALAALDRLGPEHRIETEVLGLGSQSGSTWQGRLVLRGHGDPTLTTAGLRTLALRIRAQGIERVTGRVLADETRFDALRTGSGWKSSWYKVWCPPLSALVVDRARVKRRVVDDPALAAARALTRELERAGVRVARRPRAAAPPREGVRLASVRSAPLWKLVRTMNKQSDNFYAEMLLKHLGAEVRGDGTAAAGARVVRRTLARRGVPLAGVRVADGSGLSPRNRLTARAIALLLVSARDDPALNTQYLGSLAVAGVDGTLRTRMRTYPARGNVRGKTGTTAGASALSGYARSRFVFSVLQNGRPVPWTSSRAAQDRFATLLARRAVKLGS
jgi:D-alanyl-D-alanine carboxypeptidase/D-alanyl-D-alanine-endopeptidase (penicillin-binding protein 4)